MSLTPKQEMFCREYVTDNNGTQAAIRAGYSAKTARSQAHENLTKLNIQDFISELRTEQMKSHKIQVYDVITRLLREADDRDTGTASARVSALGLLGKHLGMFVNRVDATATPQIHTITRVIVNAADYRKDDDDDTIVV